MSPAEADALARSRAAYVHIPFCSAVCPYCDFAVVAGRDGAVGRYVDAVCSEIALSDPWDTLDAIYFGGGTPSHIEPDMLGSILDALNTRHGISPGAEISLEANPEDFTLEKAVQLFALGFNRVSFGAQSFDPVVLEGLGRRHSPSDIARSVDLARVAGFVNISVDLIYGTPVESRQSWSDSLARAVATGVPHISAYALTVERGTPMGREVAAGAAAPEPDIQADRYEETSQRFSESGLDRYEVSNWSLPGNECRYNMIVWAQGEYEAYGNGAHGYRDGVRFRNHRRLDAYLERVERGERPRAGTDPVRGWDAELDRLFVGLRRSVGVSGGEGTSALLVSPEGRRLVDAGVLVSSDGRLVVAKPLLTDAVHRAVLSQRPPIVIGHGHA